MGRPDRKAPTVVHPEDEQRLLPGDWEVVRVLIYPSTIDGLRRVTVALTRDNGRSPVLVRQEVLGVYPTESINSAEDLAEFVIDALR